MNRRLHKIIVICLVFSVITSLLPGCQKRNNQDTLSSEEPVTISYSWWGNDARHMYTINGLDLFTEINPNMEVTPMYAQWNGYENRYRVCMMAQNEADVMMINYSWLDEYSQDGSGYYDLYEFSGFIDLSQFSEDELSFGVKNGKLNAIPAAFNTCTYFYNRDIFDAYGLALPKTWDDLFTSASAMSGDGIYVLGMPEKHLFFMLISYYEQTTGRYAFNDDGSFAMTQEDVEDVLDFYYELLDKHVIMPQNEWSRNSLSDKTAAGALCWISDAEEYCSIINSVGYAVIGDYIGVDETTVNSGLYIKPASMYAISQSSDNPAYSAMLVDFLLNNPDMAVLQGMDKGVPLSDSAYKALSDNMMLTGYAFEADKKMTDNRDIMRVMIPNMEDADIIDAFVGYAKQYASGNITKEESASAIVSEINEIISAKE